MPPFIPSVPTYSGFGKSSLRQSIASRQASRLFPSNDIIRDHMEEQLARWGAPQSSFRVDDILNGRHAFQKPDMPTLDVHTIEDSDQAISIDRCTADTNVDSIANSPYVTMQVGLPSIVRKSTFKESNEEIIEHKAQGLSGTTENSIQDSTYFNAEEYPNQQPDGSASIKSSYLTKIKGELEISPAIEVTQTPNASPLTEQDIPQLVKSDNPIIEVLPVQERNPEYQNDTENIYPNQVHYDNDIECLSVTGEICGDFWVDLYYLISCQGFPQGRFD